MLKRRDTEMPQLESKPKRRPDPYTIPRLRKLIQEIFDDWGGYYIDKVLSHFDLSQLGEDQLDTISEQFITCFWGYHEMAPIDYYNELHEHIIECIGDGALDIGQAFVDDITDSFYLLKKRSYATFKVTLRQVSKQLGDLFQRKLKRSRKRSCQEIVSSSQKRRKVKCPKKAKRTKRQRQDEPCIRGVKCIKV